MRLIVDCDETPVKFRVGPDTLPGSKATVVPLLPESVDPTLTCWREGLPIHTFGPWLWAAGLTAPRGGGFLVWTGCAPKTSPV